MSDREVIERFGRWLGAAERILLITHERPDGDGLSSVLAMRQALMAMGKRVDAVSRDPMPLPFQFLPAAASFQQDFFIGDYDLVATLDCGDARRTGFDERLRWFAKHKRRLINIDHHPKNDLHRMANLNIVDYEAAAAAQVVYQIFDALRWPIDHQVATCLLCGLHTDTGGFKHPNTTPTVLEIAADLLGRGGRLREINRHLSNYRSVPMLRLWGMALERLQYHRDLGIVSSMITLTDLEHCHASHDDLAGVVNLMKNTADARIAILFAEQADGLIRASLRTDADGVDVSRLASLFGGGGLKKSGGFSVLGRLKHDGDHWDIDWQ